MPDRSHTYKNVENPFLFEVAWEVAHKGTYESQSVTAQVCTVT